MLLHKSLQRLWSDTDITVLLGLRNKSILAGDLNAKHLVWNSKVSNPSGLKLLELFVNSNFKISSPQCPTHYTPDGRSNVLNTVIHQNVCLSQAIVTNILDSDHLPVMFSIRDHVRMREALDTDGRLTDCFRSSSLNWYLQISKFTLLLKLIKQNVTLQPV
jgi:hypothetical protein